MTVDAPHIPVLLDEVLTALAIADGETHLDGTFGAGGYSRAMADAGACVIAFDRDPDAIVAGRTAGDPRITLVEARFSEMASHVSAPVDGVVLDIGVSSMQLDQAARGFSFQSDGPLDMRMEQSGDSAADCRCDLPLR
jgi:16S rRNA (cytosine1402-N4)-methyltransferase